MSNMLKSVYFIDLFRSVFLFCGVFFVWLFSFACFCSTQPVDWELSSYQEVFFLFVSLILIGFWGLAFTGIVH